MSNHTERERNNSEHLIPIKCPRCKNIMQNRPLFAGNMPVEGNQVCERCFKEAGGSSHISRSERAKLEGPSKLIDIENLSQSKPLLSPGSTPAEIRAIERGRGHYATAVIVCVFLFLLAFTIGALAQA